MNKVNFYLIKLSAKYIFINILIISVFIIFLNLIEISRMINNDISMINYLVLSILKYPSILNQVLPFVIIIGISFLLRNLINNNELISMRNIGYSIFDIFIPIGLTVFFIGVFFLVFMNPISTNFENRFEKITNKKDKSVYSINLSDKEMWIKNKIDENNSIFISIENINVQNMNANDIKILLINDNSNFFIQAKSGDIKNNIISLKDVKFYDMKLENLKELKNYNLKVNFNKQNIINSISDYKLIPFYKYYSHSKTLTKFNLYSPEIGLFYISEVLKPFFLVILSFVVIGFSGKFKRNENFFKVLFISILIGFLIFLLKEIVAKVSINLSLNFYVSYLVIFLVPLSIGLYQIINIENE